MTITRGYGKEIDALIEEAFRRGFAQGFHAGIIIDADKKKKAVKHVFDWRHSQISDEFTPPPYSGFGGVPRPKKKKTKT